MRIVLDAGALVALDRGERAMWSVLAAAAADGIEIVVPSSVIAQVWRGGARQARLARALACCEISSFDPVVREIGELCGRARASDVCDAHVALTAAREPSVLYTSDVRDLRRLLAALASDALIVRC